MNSDRDKRYEKYKKQATFYHSYLHAFIPDEYKPLSGKVGKTLPHLIDIHNILSDK